MAQAQDSVISFLGTLDGIVPSLHNTLKVSRDTTLPHTPEQL